MNPMLACAYTCAWIVALGASFAVVYLIGYGVYALCARRPKRGRW